MKIKDINFYRAESYFTALVVVKGEKLNEFLRKLENAAHDDFVVSDDLKEEERERNNKILNAFYKLIENHIEQRTKIEVEDEQSLTGLNEMISFSGLVEKKENIKPKKKIPSKQKNLIKVRGTPEPGKNKRDRLNKERKRRNVTEKPSAISTRKEKGNTISLDDFTVAPTFIYNQKQNKYTMKCQPKVNIKNCEIIINAINSDGKKIKIDYIIDKVWDEEKDYVNDGSIVKNINFKKDKLKNIYISFKEKSKFQLITEIIGESDG
ncbi:MAG TPA: hypothetical protein GX708_19700 [Gallicola sp.]|nr:hypothetical protein [Gallicola sp.]